jgi:hypothetical protein
VVRRVSHHAHTEGEKRSPPRPFTGWAACSRNHFATSKCNIPVASRPLEDGTNPYHAEMVRNDYRAGSGPYAFATMIRDVVTQQGHFTKSPPRRTPKGSDAEADASGPSAIESPVASLPPTVEISPSQIARIRTWVKYGMKVAQVAQVCGVSVGEIERILGKA